ncbi:uncharacterized protein LOC112561108 [Pomacea canaliculata]|uniref:uncharacterized protein LOC112561108 n=1 Tax=Pomacea canaliculata TaxID=400727 RepID=UPI000D73D3FD|nr:uncharacterized protein LOC112561108 [Pomacea canaliculata]
MYQVSQYLLRSTPYWLGATDHVWAFAPESNIFGKTAPDFEVVRCGHMFLERTGESSQSFEWKWAGTRCDQQKSYICQYAVTEQARFASSSSTKDNVVCPWKIPPIPTQPPVNTLVPPIHTTADTGSGMTLPALVADGGDGETGYPIAAIIAACIAALVILLCAIFMLGYSRRRKWLLEKWKRTREYLWPFWTSAPTYVTADHSHSDPGFDTLSTGHTAFHSDSGSVLLSGTLPHPSLLHESAAYKNAHAHRSTSDLKDASKRNESFEKVSRRANQSMTSSGGSAKTGGGLLRMGGMGGDGSATEGGYGGISLLSDGLTLSGGGGGGVGGGTGSLLEEHLMSASYSSLSPRAREYMTLSAHMNIHEETDSPFLGKRKKPEVALVTNDVDLNFTVNHAYARSRQGSERSSEKGLDEIDLNLGSTVEIPTRTVEESLMYY